MAAAERFSRVDRARREHGEILVDRIIADCFAGDPDADELALHFREMPAGSGWRQLDRALREYPLPSATAAPCLGRLLDPIFSLPDWLDLDLVDAGAVATWRAGGLNQLLVLSAGSLAFGYRSASLARPLAATGRLADGAARRLNQTLRWLVTATRPGAMRPGGDGLAATVRLRLVHALVRAHLGSGEDWDEANWGVPISASDMSLTGIGGFFLVPLRALEDLGVRYSPGELEALLHQWRWISFVMGVPERCLPATLEEARGQLDAALAIDSGPSPESVLLMRALLEEGTDFERMLPALPARVLGGAHSRISAAFIRRWMGAEMADRLGVPGGPMHRFAVTAVRPLVRGRELARAGGLLGDDEELAEREHRLVEGLMKVGGGGERMISPKYVARRPVEAA